MGLLKVVEFAKKYDIKRENVYTYHKREKLIIENGILDEDNPINRIFIDSRKSSLKVVIAPDKIIKNNKPVKSKKLENKETVKDENIKDTETKDDIYRGYSRLQELREQKLIEEVRFGNIRNDRIEGILVPIELVKQSISEIISRYKMSFIQQTDQLVRDTLNEVGASNAIITGACSKLVDIANESSHRAVAESKLAMQNIINESLKVK